ncbi:MAG: hypothetical protein E7487_01045 [Ruminococcaceae bacterium]|nr:hypothetical protein [Oscillospiraceae bacterium]
MKKVLKKRVLTAFLLIISLVVFGAFAGCNKNPDDQSSEGLSEGELSGGSEESDVATEGSISAYIYATEETKSAWTAAIQAFENETNVAVEAVIGEDVADKVRTDILAGMIPDVVFLPSWEGSGVTEALIADKALAELTGVEGLSGDINSYCQPYGDGKTYIAPVGKTVFGVWYNPAVVTEAPANIDALASYKAAEGSAVFTFAGKDADTLKGLFTAALLSVADTATADSLFGMDSAAWDDANVAAAIDMLAALSAEGIVLEDSYQYSQGDVYLALVGGEAAFGVLTDINGAKVEAAQTATIAAAENEEYTGATADEVNAAELKFLPLGTSYAQLGDLYIPVESANVELAKKFVSVVLASDMSALNGNTAEAGETYSYRAPLLSAEADKDFERTLVNTLTSMLYGDTDADAFVSRMKSVAEELKEFIIG